MNGEEGSDGLSKGKGGDGLISVDYWQLDPWTTYLGKGQKSAEELSVMQVRKDGAEFRVVIGLDGEAMLFGGFDGELGETREGVGDAGPTDCLTCSRVIRRTWEESGESCAAAVHWSIATAKSAIFGIPTSDGRM
jgi:hypothetical protein